MVDTALLSWLAAGADTACLKNVAIGVGSAGVTTAATSRRAVLAFATPALAEIAVTEEGMQMSHDADVNPTLRQDDYGASGVARV